MKANLYTLLSEDVTGNSFIGLTTVTNQKLKGGSRNPFQGKVRKVMQNASVMVFNNAHTYETMVRNRLKREGKDPDSFSMQSRTWGERIPNTPFVEYKGRYYLEVIILNPGRIFFTVEGVEVPPSKIKGLEYPPEADQGGLSNKIVIRTYAVENIRVVKFHGMSYADLYFKKI